LDDLGSPHIRSFDWACDEGLRKAVQGLPAISFEVPSTRDRITLTVSVSRRNIMIF
jgi:hypothetical protein